MVIKGDGRDVRGAGNASAVITAQLTEISPTTTQVSVKTELTITGKVAQFGRGAISDVSAKLMTSVCKKIWKDFLSRTNLLALPKSFQISQTRMMKKHSIYLG